MRNAFDNVVTTPRSSPDLVADVIWTAANDTSDRLRYSAGPDAAELLDRRKMEDDATFIGSIRALMSE